MTIGNDLGRSRVAPISVTAFAEPPREGMGLDGRRIPVCTSSGGIWGACAGLSAAPAIPNARPPSARPNLVGGVDLPHFRGWSMVFISVGPGGEHRRGRIFPGSGSERPPPRVVRDFVPPDRVGRGAAGAATLRVPLRRAVASRAALPARRASRSDDGRRKMARRRPAHGGVAGRRRAESRNPFRRPSFVPEAGSAPLYREHAGPPPDARGFLAPWGAPGLRRPAALGVSRTWSRRS